MAYRESNITPIEQFVIDFVTTLRNKRNLNQQDIADIIGVSRGFISDVESRKKPAKYNIRHINALADYFGMSPREFLPEKAFPVDVVEKEKEKKVVKKATVKKATKKKS
jgi:transcriptional regulator with XRE-family HTH domain